MRLDVTAVRVVPFKCHLYIVYTLGDNSNPVITENSSRTREPLLDQLMLAKAGVLTDFPHITGT